MNPMAKNKIKNKKNDNAEASNNIVDEFAYLHQYSEHQDSHQDEEEHDQILQVQCQGG